MLRILQKFSTKIYKNKNYTSYYGKNLYFTLIILEFEMKSKNKGSKYFTGKFYNLH